MRQNSSMRCLLVLVTALALTAAGEMSLTVEKLTEFIRSAAQKKQPDKQVAETLRHFKMVEKLDDRTVEELQSLGAGPKSVAALERSGRCIRQLAGGRSASAQTGGGSTRAAGLRRTGKIIDEAREYVLNYTKSLPNFICVQVTRRDVDRGGTGSSWYHLDTITAKLSYNGQHEDYEVILKNDQPVTNVKMEQLGGTVSAGEFGSMMSEIFEPQSQAQFSWDHWATLRGRRTYVFAYDIEQQYSQYRIKELDTRREIVPGLPRAGLYRPRQQDGDQDHPESLQYSFRFPNPLRSESLDYDLQSIGDAPVYAAVEGCSHFQTRPLHDQERHRVPAVSQV